MQNIQFEIHFNDTLKWNQWYNTQFIEKICTIFGNDKMFLVEKTNTRWQIITKYKIHTFSNILCAIELIENYEPSYNIYGDDDFVFIQMKFYFTNIEGLIATLSEDIYLVLNNELKLLYNELISMSSTFDRTATSLIR